MSIKTNALHILRTNAQATTGASELDQLVIFAATHTAAETLAQLGSSDRGLAPDILAASRELHGPNVVEAAGRPSLARRVVAAFATTFTLILVALAGISLYTNVILAAPDDRDPSTAIIIAVMVAVSGILSLVQEGKGANAAASLQKLVTNTCCVIRAGEPEQELPMAEVVPGDVIRLAAGDLVPADLRILEAKDLFVNESALTGESEPVEKVAAPVTTDTEAAETGVAPARLALTDCTNIAFSGTTVQSGSATAVAVATAGDACIGKLSRTLGDTSRTSAFDRGVADVSRVLVGFMLVMCPIVFLASGLTKGNWLDALLFSVSVAVGITPQMLPVIVTTCLARGAQEMSRRDVIVKELPAIQNLGAMDVLCCDKTGTLTEDKVVLERHMDVMGNEDDRVLRHAYLNARFQTGLRNLIDRAIVERGEELLDASALDGRYRKVDEIPFDFERRLMSVVVTDETGKTQMVTKGAVEEILAACSHVEYAGAVSPLTDDLRERVRVKVRELGAQGMRVVAVAQKTNPRPAGAFSTEDERDMVLIGYLAFLDPPKASAAEAVAELERRGVAVKVLTGDNELVAAAVCAKVGVDATDALVGTEVDTLADDELATRAESTQLFARLSPLQKARVVRVLREQAGHTVGFMGDGINDAAAMRASDCGISVDTAVDVAKDSAPIILLEKDLRVLARGIREGRRTYANTVKYIKLTASSNFGNVLSVLVASIVLPFMPMTALQLLLLGLAYTVACVALPWDNVDEAQLAGPQSWDARSVISFMLWMGPVSTVFDLLTFAAMFWLVCPAVVGAPWAALAGAGTAGAGIAAGGMAASTATALFAAVFQTGWFVESMWTQTLVIHALRSVGGAGASRPTRALVALTVGGVAVVTALPWTPGVADALGLVALPVPFFVLLAGLMAGYLGLAHVAKRLYVHRHGSLL
ncbi:magnesium-translocating P-type ATPase [uncultured Parolsenella sp.]|uniref:magnesium-translocating P-type ATPase n=1 Tax=uncultured Parolsenella sp. TaxID=2083008 RepID=UPI0027D96B15|nr:magnesium-translocating P-type ATPase [uncultured Parolsenella sp.]